MSDCTKSQLKWLSTVMFLLAGILISANLPVTRYAFFMLLVGHVSLVWLFLRERDRPMLVQNLFFIPIDLIGIYRWFLA